jgi:hypothetical protein
MKVGIPMSTSGANFSAAAADHQHAKFRARVMRHPEREMRRVGKHVEHLHVPLRLADAHDALPGVSQVKQVAGGITKGQRLSGATRGEGEKGRAKLALEGVLHGRASTQQRAQDGGGTACEDVFVGNEDEVERMILDVALDREREMAQILDAADAGQIVGERRVVLGKRKDGLLNVAPQKIALPP